MDFLLGVAAVELINTSDLSLKEFMVIEVLSSISDFKISFSLTSIKRKVRPVTFQFRPRIRSIRDFYLSAVRVASLGTRQNDENLHAKYFWNRTSP